jgi:hypothetical protein
MLRGCAASPLASDGGSVRRVSIFFERAGIGSEERLQLKVIVRDSLRA